MENTEVVKPNYELMPWETLEETIENGELVGYHVRVHLEKMPVLNRILHLAEQMSETAITLLDESQDEVIADIVYLHGELKNAMEEHIQNIEYVQNQTKEHFETVRKFLESVSKDTQEIRELIAEVDKPFSFAPPSVN